MMNNILFIEDNISSIKDICRTTFKDIKSSHLSEAIAHAFGFNSNIALKTSLKNCLNSPKKVKNFNQNIFLEWLKSRNYNNLQSFPSEILEKIPVPLWIIIKETNIRKKLDTMDSWFKTCKKYNIPYVYIDAKRKYASVEWDYYTVNEHHNPKKFTKELTFDILNKANSINCSKAKYNFSAFTGNIDNLDINSAKDFGGYIFNLLNQLIEN